MLAGTVLIDSQLPLEVFSENSWKGSPLDRKMFGLPETQKA